MRSEQRTIQALEQRIAWLESENQRQANLLSKRADDLYRVMRERDEAQSDRPAGLDGPDPEDHRQRGLGPHVP